MKQVQTLIGIQLFVETAPMIAGDPWWLSLPQGWEILRQNEFIIYAQRADGLRIAASAAVYGEIPWIHGSCSREDRMPSYPDLCDLKRVVFGPKRFAAQLFVPESQHVNIHPRCLHLWGPMDEGCWPLPDFTMGQGSI